MYRKQPDNRTFEHLYRELSTSRSCNAYRLDTGIGRYRGIPDVEKKMLNIVENNPLTSSKVAGHTLGMSYSTSLVVYMKTECIRNIFRECKQ